MALLRQHHHQSEKRLSSRIPLVRSIADVGKKRCDHQQHGERASEEGCDVTEVVRWSDGLVVRWSGCPL